MTIAPTDTHAIPAHDDADRDLCADEACGECPPVPAAEHPKAGDWADINLRHALVESVTHDDGEVILTFGHEAMSDTVAVVLNDDITATVRTEDEVHADHAPAKTHDLTVFLRLDTWADTVLIAVSDEADDYRLYLPTASAKVLGRMLKVLTPAQVAILADELTGGAA